MQTTITARHCEIPDAAAGACPDRGRAPGRARPPADRGDRGLRRATARCRTVELRLHVSRGEVLIAKGDGDDHRTALDRAEDKLRRQLEKVSQPRRSRPSQAKQL